MSHYLNNRKVTKNVLFISKHSVFFELKSHDYFQDLIELVGGEAFDVFGAVIEVSSDVNEDSEVGIERGGVAFEDFKISVAGR